MVEVRPRAASIPYRKPVVPSPSASRPRVRSEAPEGRRLLEDDSEGDHTKALEGLHGASRQSLAFGPELPHCLFGHLDMLVKPRDLVVGGFAL
ncbi:hypothetical protein GUJ93_ZPchr0008g13882 [Zizania palustris]|uniref:Uncharacterized protein n=1 Tax=Zizania palustris TaxID=103762 RepID=A0A8J5RZM0_ZIZPA|nr:hypothetical protein GUJ93_ZPchr0008g13882 [Zizania palustris]